MPPSNLTDHLGFWLRTVSNQVSHAFAARVAAKGVTVAEWVVMRCLYEAPMAPSRLAAEIGMTRGAITKLADRLIAKSLIVRAASPSDGRAQTLALTPAGLALLPELATIADTNDAAFFAALPPADRAALRRILRAIAEAHGLTSFPVD